MLDLRELTEFFKDAFGYIITFVVLIIIFVFFISFVPVAGNSMSPNLVNGDILMTSKVLKAFTNFKRDDIVTFQYDKKNYIKRIIGLPGERIDYVDGLLYINNEAYVESAIENDVVTDNFVFENICSKNNCPDGVIPENMYLVLGDYREDSKDSREIGLITKKQIIGKIYYRIWPLKTFSKIK